MPKLVWICPKNPLSSFDGVRKATTTLVKSLTKEGVTIHLVILSAQNNFSKSELVNGLGVSHVSFLGTNSKFPRRFVQFVRKLLRPLTPFAFQAFNSSELKSRVNSFLEQERYDYIVCDSLLACIPVPYKYYKQLIYRAHNVEHELWLRWSEQSVNPLNKILGRIEANFVRRFERKVVEGARAIAPTSVRDGAILSALQSKASNSIQSDVIPIGFPFIEPLPFRESKKFELLWIGKLDWKPNYEGLRWFLRDVWPSVRSLVHLTIIGSGRLPYEINDGAELEESEITFAPNAEDLVPYYTTAQLCLVPVQYGSGTRVKAIEAASFGRACLSTQLGLEGLALEHGKSAILAETAEDWISAIKGSSLKFHSILGINAFNSLKFEWEEQRIARKFNALLKTLK